MRTRSQMQGPLAFACLALVGQGLIALVTGSRFLIQAGRIPDPTLSGFAGVLGLALLAPAVVAIVAGVATWRGHDGGRRAGLVMGAVGAVVGLLVAVAAALSANPGVLVLALALIAVNAATFQILRRRLP
jgi:uncharacterized membrane protein HdeD (DUF308 family)